MKHKGMYLVMDILEAYEILRDMKFDGLITDGPYGIANGASVILRKQRTVHKDIADSKWDQFDGVDNLCLFYDKWISKYVKLIKPGGHWIMFMPVEFVGLMRAIYEKYGVYHKAAIIWHKTNPVPQFRKKNFLSSVEAITWGIVGGNNKDFYFSFKTQNEMHNHVEFPICQGKERMKHPTQKPLRLMKWITDRLVRPNSTIIDPFVGTGTTIINGENEGHWVVGIDKNPHYRRMYQKRHQRLNHISK